MALLRKLKASTLMETLVATILIVVVFMVASLILNNLFANSIRNNTSDIEPLMNELLYNYLNEKIDMPYNETIDNWDITTATTTKDNGMVVVEFVASNSQTKQILTKSTHEIQ